MRTNAHTHTCSQLGQGPAHQPGRGDQEDHEALQHSRALEAHIPRAEAAQAPQARECGHPPMRQTMGADFDVGQIISLSDIFISPLEDMYGNSTSECQYYMLIALATSSPNCSGPISTACSPRDHSRSSSSSTSSTRSWCVATTNLQDSTNSHSAV